VIKMNGWAILKGIGVILVVALVVGLVLGLVFWPIAIALLWHYGVMSFETAVIIMLTITTIEVMGLEIKRRKD